MGIDRLQRMEEIEGKFIPKLKQRTAQEWFAEGLQRKIPIVPVPDIGDLIARRREEGARGDRSDHDRRRDRVYRGLDAAIDRHAAAARRGGSRDRRAACSAAPIRRCCRARAVPEPDGQNRLAARRHARDRFLDGLGRSDLHAHAGRSWRRRDQDRGDRSIRTGGAASTAARPMCSNRCTRSRCATAS